MTPMLDLVFVVLSAALFLGALIYARACANVWGGHVARRDPGRGRRLVPAGLHDLRAALARKAL